MQLGEGEPLQSLSRVCGQNVSSPEGALAPTLGSSLPSVNPEKHLLGELGRKGAFVCTVFGLGFFVCLFGFGFVLVFFFFTGFSGLLFIYKCLREQSSTFSVTRHRLDHWVGKQSP